MSVSFPSGIKSSSRVSRHSGMWLSIWLVFLSIFSLHAGEVSYRYFRFTPVTLRDAAPCCVQLSEFEFTLAGNVVGNPTATNPGGNNPAGETPGMAVDGDTSTKWLDFNLGPLVFDFGSVVTVDSYRWATANDAIGRDPLRWIVDASNDGVIWVTVHQQTDQDYPTPTARFTYLPHFDFETDPGGGGGGNHPDVEYRYYRFTPTKLRGTNACCVQLSEFEFRHDNLTVTNTPIVTNPGGNNPAAETPDLSVDGNLGTKWLDYNQGGLVFDFGQPQLIDSYLWATANDATERDPVRWTLEGSTDGINWILIDERIDEDFPVSTARFTYTPVIVLNAAPAVISFEVDRPLIPANLPITLSWEIDPSATDVSIDQGIGSVFSQTVNGLGQFTLDPGPNVTTTYTITATHDAGTSEKNVTVVVTDQPVIQSFIATPSSISPGGSSTLSWEVFNTDTVSINGNVIGGNNSLIIAPSQSEIQTLSASNANGTATASLVVSVVEPGVPVISEFMASNDGALVNDEDGDDSDWIEIFNPSEITANLDGYYLTDDPANLTKWTFPAQSLTAGEYLLVWASGKDRRVSGNELHTNFSLQASGEYLALVKPDGVTIVSEFGSGGTFYPDQDPGISFGGFGDLLDHGYFYTATPGAENSEGYLDEVADTTFSVKRGFFDSAFLLEIATETTNAVIRYTTDGSKPSETHGTIYTAPFTVDRTMPVRAIAYRKNFRSTNIDTQTYIFVDDVITQSPINTQSIWGLPASWNGTSPDYGMDPNVTTPHAATIRDDLKTVPTLSLVLPQEDLFGSNGNYSHPLSSGLAWEREMSMELIDPANPDGTQNFQIDCGLRIQGGAFRRFDLTKRSPSVSSSRASTAIPNYAIRFLDQMPLRNSTPSSSAWNPTTATSGATALMCNTRVTNSDDAPLSISTFPAHVVAFSISISMAFTGASTMRSSDPMFPSAKATSVPKKKNGTPSTSAPPSTTVEPTTGTPSSALPMMSRPPPPDHPAPPPT